METVDGMKWNVYQQDCPTRLALDRIADKWTVLIVGRLSGGTRRFGELRREVSGISPKVLTQKLRELERDGILTRKVYASVPPRVEYTLTPLGKTLIGLLDAVRVWAESHIETMLEAQSTYDRHAAEEVA
ncbi:MAG: helix-turn-helix domain-containing protein [Anaerolineaceae bacterium]|nr:helix-turn-helix domain-containing protein [Anaerolineaceae bacterium]